MCFLPPACSSSFRTFLFVGRWLNIPVPLFCKRTAYKRFFKSIEFSDRRNSELRFLRPGISIERVLCKHKQISRSINTRAYWRLISVWSFRSYASTENPSHETANAHTRFGNARKFLLPDAFRLWLFPSVLYIWTKFTGVAAHESELFVQREYSFFICWHNVIFFQEFEMENHQ